MLSQVFVLLFSCSNECGERISFRLDIWVSLMKLCCPPIKISRYFELFLLDSTGKKRTKKWNGALSNS